MLLKSCPFRRITDRVTQPGCAQHLAIDGSSVSHPFSLSNTTSLPSEGLIIFGSEWTGPSIELQWVEEGRVMEDFPRNAQRTQSYAEDFMGDTNTAYGDFRASRHFLPTCARFSSRLYLRTGSQILSIGSADLVSSQSMTGRWRVHCLHGVDT